ncbi:MAG: hypothetical protein RIR79_94 [Pseudomonadota bacterium]|jgi:shikimate kinase
MIALIGLPGCGKSTVGRQLARRLQVPFLDSDSVIETRLGYSIKEAFERDGEAHFRDLEESVLDELSQIAEAVISTGGGAILRAATRQRLRERGTVVYLNAHPDKIFRRLQNDTTRPLLQVANPIGRLRELYAARNPLYREAAHFIIDTGRPSVNTLINTILMQLEQSKLAIKK